MIFNDLNGLEHGDGDVHPRRATHGNSGRCHVVDDLLDPLHLSLHLLAIDVQCTSKEEQR